MSWWLQANTGEVGVTLSAHRDLWRFSPTPISQPLLRRLLNKEELAHQACVIYQVNLKAARFIEPQIIHLS